MNDLTTFVGRCLAGLESPDAVDDYVGAWHDDADDGRPLHLYLGMTWAEYRAWAEGKKTAGEIVRGRKGAAGG